MSCHVSRLAPKPWIKTIVGDRFDFRLASKLTETPSTSTDCAGRGTAAPQLCSICAAVHPNKIRTTHPHKVSTVFDVSATPTATPNSNIIPILGHSAKTLSVSALDVTA